MSDEIGGCSELSLKVVAPAGCGKTQLLASRAGEILSHYTFAGNGRKLLILTFTNNARDNIRERLLSFITERDIREHIYLSNFHGFSSRIIEAHGSLVGIDESWQLPKNDWVGKWCRERHYPYKQANTIKSLLGRAKLSCSTDNEVMLYLHRAGNSDAIEAEQDRVKLHQLTYDDLIRLAVLILDNRDVANLYANHFLAGMVDEYQDLTLQQLNLIKKVCYKRTTYAGDISQGIYSFAGADPNKVSCEIDRECGDATVHLTKSWRSSPAVLDAVNALVKLTGGEILSSARPDQWGTGGLMSCVEFSSRTEEAQWVARLSCLITSRCPNQRIGIIGRSGYRLREVEDELKSLDAGYCDWGDGVYDKGTARFMRTICSSFTADAIPDSSSRRNYVIEAAKAFINGGEESDDFQDGIGWLIDQLDKGCLPADISERIHVRKGKETVATTSGIHCLTGHAGKGQQFDWVFAVGAEEGTLPDYRADTEVKIAEEARVFSVMLSRARIGVMITYSDSHVSPYGESYSDKPSRFIKPLLGQARCLNKDQTEKWLSAADWGSLKTM